MPDVYKLDKHYHYHLQFHVQHSYGKQVTTVQSNCIIFFQDCFEIPSFCNYVFIFKKIKSTHEGNF